MLNDKDVKRLEERINILKKDYDLHLAGIIKLEPVKEREELQLWLRKHTASEIINSALRFKYNTLVSKFNALNTYWDRMVKRKDILRDKIHGGPPRAAPPAEKPAAPKPPREKAPQAWVFEKADAGDVESKARQVYDRYLAARKAAGEAGGPDFGVFKNTLTKRLSDMLGRTPGGQVEFSVKTEDGKVKLKATARGKGKSA